MLELNIYQNQVQGAETYGKWYARVEGKEQLSVHDMAVHMAKHNTPFSIGTIEGILIDFVECTREQCLQGNTVKIDNLAIFKLSVSANGLVLCEDAKVIAGIGSIPATKNADGTSRTPDYTQEGQSAIGTVRLQAQATGEFTKKQLNDEAKFRWTKAAREKIDAIVNPDGGTTGGNTNTGGGITGGSTGGNTGGNSGGNSGGGDNGGGGFESGGD